MNDKEKLKHELLLNDAYAIDIIRDTYGKLIQGKISNDEFVKKISVTMDSHSKVKEHIIVQSYLNEIDREFAITELRKEILGE